MSLCLITRRQKLKQHDVNTRNIHFIEILIEFTFKSFGVNGKDKESSHALATAFFLYKPGNHQPYADSQDSHSLSQLAKKNHLLPFQQLNRHKPAEGFPRQFGLKTEVYDFDAKKYD